MATTVDSKLRLGGFIVDRFKKLITELHDLKIGDGITIEDKNKIAKKIPRKIDKRTIN